MPKFEQILYGLTQFNRNNALQTHILLLLKHFVNICRNETKILSLHKFNTTNVKNMYLHRDSNPGP